MGRYLLTFLIVAFSFASPATAEDSTVLEPQGPWEVRRDDDTCIARSTYGIGENAFALEIERGYSIERYTPVFISENLPELPNPPLASLIFLPSKTRLDLIATGKSLMTREASYRMYGNTGDLVSALKENQILVYTVGADFHGAIYLRNTDASLANLGQCHADLLAEVGFDISRIKELATLPQIDQAKPLLTLVDTSVELLPRNSNAQVVVLLEVDAEGDVTECRILRSSGFISVDQLTCLKLKSRAEFVPATDTAGMAVSAPYITSVSYEVK